MAVSTARKTLIAHLNEDLSRLSEFAIAQDIREILSQEHQIDLATALGADVPDVSSRRR